MVEAVFRVKADAWMSRVSFGINCAVDGDYLGEAYDPSLVAYLVNKYAKRLVVLEDGFGYEAELPEEARIAVHYLTRVRSASREDIDEIMATGESKLHRFLKRLGYSAERLFSTGGVCKPASTSIDGKRWRLEVYPSEFPKVYLSVKGEEVLPNDRIAFNAGAINTDFLKRVLNGETSEAEEMMLRGILLFREEGQRKYMLELSHGRLNVEKLVRALVRAAISARYKETWLPIADWLKKNGFESASKEIIIKKTLCEG
mgnify:FL=1